MSTLKIKKKELIFVIIYCVLFLFWSTPGLMKYVITMFFSAFVLIYKRKGIEKKHLYLFLPGIVYLIFGSVGNIINNSFSFYSIKQLLLIFVTSVAAIGLHYLFKGSNINVIQLMFISIVLCCIRLIPRFTFDDLLESSYCFIFGVFVIYFFLKKNYMFTCLAGILCFLTNKRIAEFAVVISLVLFLFLNPKKHKKSFKYILAMFIVLIIVFAYVFIWMIKNGTIVEFLRKNNISLMGREYIWSAFESDSLLSIEHFGRGTGFVFSKLDFIRLEGLSGNLHSDLYATYIEIGFIGYGMWISSYYLFIKKMYGKDNIYNKTFIFLLLCITYTLLLYTTDNVLIYIDYWLPLNLIILEVTNRQKIDNLQDKI